MSITQLDSVTYHDILRDTFTRYVRYGMTQIEAAYKAQELMDNAFVCVDAEAQLDAELEWDRHSPENQRWHE